MIEMVLQRLGDLEYSASEAINTLAANLFFVGGNMKSILVTSCQPQEGKSFVAVNLMRTMASLGFRVVLLDADIRASALQGSCGIEIQMSGSRKYKGLTGYLFGQCEIEDILAETNIPGAHMVLAGRTVMNSLPLLNTERLGTLLNELSAKYDLVLIDAPPVGAIIDAAMIATLCDGVLFVVQAGADTVAELREASTQIEKSGRPVIGYVINKFEEKRHGDRSYYHKTEYYRVDTRKQSKKFLRFLKWKGGCCK